MHHSKESRLARRGSKHEHGADSPPKQKRQAEQVAHYGNVLGGPGRNRTTDTMISNPISTLITIVDSLRSLAVNQLSCLHHTFWHAQERPGDALT
jgi:hypothetical protein